MKEVKDKIQGLISTLPIMKDFGSLDKHVLKVITDELNEVLLLLDSSLQLKEKETITFEDWLIKHSFKRIGNSYVYKKGDSNYDREQLRKLYKMNN